MHFRQLLSLSALALLPYFPSTLSISTCPSRSSTAPGYGRFSSIPANQTISFGSHYAVLNLDLINLIVAPLANTTAGQSWISSITRWIDAVHAQNPPPLSIFTRIFFANSRQPELGAPTVPFNRVAGRFPGGGTENLTATELYPAFVPTGDDVVFTKVRYYAGAGNALEIILSSQGIDTVILSGVRSSGVILSTAYRLFDLNYNVYVISDNVIEGAPDYPGINRAILEGIIPKLPANVITLDQALAALNNSGPAVYYP